MPKKGTEGMEPITDPSRTPRKIDDQTASTEPGFTSREHRHRGGQDAGTAERLCHAARRSIDHGSCGLGRLVPRRETSASGREDDIDVARVRPGQEGGNYCGRAVGNHCGTRDLVSGFCAPRPDERPAAVLRFAPGATIAHRQDPDPKCGFTAGRHRFSDPPE